MRAVTAGRRVIGRLKPLTVEDISLKTSVQGELYEIHITTDGIPNPRIAVETLAYHLHNSYGAETFWAHADGRTIKLQITGSPFAWAALIPFIPLILSGIGVLVTFIAVWQIFAGIPSWAWALLVIGLSSIFIIPSLFKVGRAKWREV